MDFITILICIGFVFSGALIGLAIGFPLGQRSVWNKLNNYVARKNK